VGVIGIEKQLDRLAQVGMSYSRFRPINKNCLYITSLHHFLSEVFGKDILLEISRYPKYI
jgi:hypothetical protein